MVTCGQIEQIYSDQETVRFMLQWHITHRCNLRCEHCYQETYERDELPLRDLRNILNQFRTFIEAYRERTGDHAARGYITVTGGEPFSRSDFPELVREFAANRSLFSFSVLTNGTMLSESMIRLLIECKPGYVQVSIDGAAATHDEIRGPGSFQKSMVSIQRLVEGGVRTMIAFTAHRGNYREFPEVARIARQMRVSRVWSDRLIPNGSGNEIKDQMLTPSETREFFELMQAAREENEREDPNGVTEVAMHRALQFLVGDGYPYHCTAGDTLFTVMPNGDFYPCRRMPIRVGNLMEHPLSELYNCRIFRELRDPHRVSSGCQSCSHNGHCRGGLKCLSYAVTGDPFQADPGCWHAEGSSNGQITIHGKEEFYGKGSLVNLSLNSC